MGQKFEYKKTLIYGCIEVEFKDKYTEFYYKWKNTREFLFKVKNLYNMIQILEYCKQAEKEIKEIEN